MNENKLLNNPKNLNSNKLLNVVLVCLISGNSNSSFFLARARVLNRPEPGRDSSVKLYFGFFLNTTRCVVHEWKLRLEVFSKTFTFFTRPTSSLAYLFRAQRTESSATSESQSSVRSILSKVNISNFHRNIVVSWVVATNLVQRSSKLLLATRWLLDFVTVHPWIAHLQV